MTKLKSCLPRKAFKFRRLYQNRKLSLLATGVEVYWCSTITLEVKECDPHPCLLGACLKAHYVQCMPK